MLPALNTILYATDLGHHAPKVFRYALSLADRYGAKIHIVHALEPLPASARRMLHLYASGEVTPEVERQHADTLRSAMGQHLREFCAQEQCLASRGKELVAGYEVVEGRPADVILAEQARLAADLIVLGSHGHGTVGDVLLDSVAHRVVQKATVPVLLVRVAEEDTQDGL